MNEVSLPQNDNTVIVNILKPVPNSVDIFDLSRNLGLWSDDMHNTKAVKPKFVKDLSRLSPSELSDLYGAWTYEFGRIMEICGVLSGQESLLKLQLKSALATARANIRKNKPQDVKSYTATMLNDLADEDPSVIEVYKQISLVTVMLAQAVASKEITSQFLASLSREISWRDAQIKAKIY